MGILPVKLDDRHPEGGSDPKGYRVPPTAAEMERYAAWVDGMRLVRDGSRRGMERAVRGSGRPRGQGVRKERL